MLTLMHTTRIACPLLEASPTGQVNSNPMFASFMPRQVLLLSHTGVTTGNVAGVPKLVVNTLFVLAKRLGMRVACWALRAEMERVLF